MMHGITHAAAWPGTATENRRNDSSGEAAIATATSKRGKKRVTWKDTTTAPTTDKNESPSDLVASARKRPRRDSAQQPKANEDVAVASSVTVGLAKQAHGRNANFVLKTLYPIAFSPPLVDRTNRTQQDAPSQEAVVRNSSNSSMATTTTKKKKKKKKERRRNEQEVVTASIGGGKGRHAHRFLHHQPETEPPLDPHTCYVRQILERAEFRSIRPPSSSAALLPRKRQQEQQTEPPTDPHTCYVRQILEKAGFHSIRTSTSTTLLPQQQQQAAAPHDACGDDAVAHDNLNDLTFCTLPPQGQRGGIIHDGSGSAVLYVEFNTNRDASAMMVQAAKRARTAATTSAAPATTTTTTFTELADDDDDDDNNNDDATGEQELAAAASSTAALAQTTRTSSTTNVLAPRVSAPSAIVPWESRRDELIHYKEEHGDCNVPNQYAPNPPLGHWVKRQRSQKELLKRGNKSNMTPARVKALEDIGFAWTIKPTRTQTQMSWESLRDELLLYKEEHGDCNVPNQHAPNPALGHWVKRQRSQKSLWEQGKKSSMTPARVKALEDIGFAWTIKPTKSQIQTCA